MGCRVGIARPTPVPYVLLFSHLPLPPGAPNKASMGPDPPGARCCAATATPPVPATFYKGSYLFSTCAQDATQCADAAACSSGCCSTVVARDVGLSRYCGCAPNGANMGATDPGTTCCNVRCKL